jgi:hypothetical protein
MVRPPRILQLALFCLADGKRELAMFAQEPCASEATPEQIRYMTQTREARQNFDVATLRGTVSNGCRSPFTTSPAPTARAD